MIRGQKVLFLLLGFCLIGACKKNGVLRWDTKNIVPLARTEFKLVDLIPDSLQRVESDSSLTIVYSKNISTLKLGDHLKIPDTTIFKSVSLANIDLGNSSIYKEITLGEVAHRAGLPGEIIIVNQGKKASVPPFKQLSPGSTEIDGTSLFQSATFITGQLELKISNGFPISITKVKYILKNFSDSSIVLEDSIDSIPAKSSIIRKYSLAGKTIEGKMITDILSINSPGSEGKQIQIDTTDALGLRLTASNLKIKEATAIFPSQNVVEEKVNIGYDLKGPQITYMKLKSGTITVETSSRLKDTLYINYSLPGATIKGEPLQIKRVVPPSSGTGASVIKESFSVAGYEIDLTGKNKDSFNTFYNTLTVRIDSSGKLEKLSLGDSISIKYSMKGIVPEYVRGYFGQDRFDVNSSGDEKELYTHLTGGKLNLKDLKIGFTLTNGVGVAGSVTILGFTATNTRTGEIKKLEGSIVNSTHLISAATDNPYTASVKYISLGNNNSNISDVLPILPDRYESKVRINMNPNGNVSNFNDFYYSFCQISADLDIEMPLNVSLSQLTLEDTFEADLSSVEQPELIKDATLHLWVDNGFPYSGKLQLWLMNDTGKIVDTLLLTPFNIFNAAEENSGANRVIKPNSTELIAILNDQSWANFLKARKLKIMASFNSGIDGKSYKLYENYKLGIRLTGSFTYEVGN